MPEDSGRRRSWRSWAGSTAVVPRGALVIAVIAVVVLVAVLLTAVVWSVGPTRGGAQEEGGGSAPSSSTVHAPECEENDPITATLSNGSAWTMCWSVDHNAGLVLRDVSFAPAGHKQVLVLQSLSVGQLEVPYDTGLRNTEDITDQGFGGRSMLTLTGASCGGERIATELPVIEGGEIGSLETREVLCLERVAGGIAYHAQAERVESVPMVTRRTDLRLTTISKVGWYEYLTQYTFGADGSITPELGATGDLSPADYTDSEHGWAIGEGDHDHAASHSHNVVWKVHWALGGRGGQRVEQYDTRDTGEMGPKAPIVAGNLDRIAAEATRSHADRRWWRVVNPDRRNTDDHPISYQIDLGASSSFTFVRDEGHEHGGYDIAFTEAKSCEEFATANRDGHCGSGVPDYVDGEQLDDVVSWVAVGFHHVPRDEDQSPMESHWQGFTMFPRDVTATRPDVPPAARGTNGNPSPSPAG